LYLLTEMEGVRIGVARRAERSVGFMRWNLSESIESATVAALIHGVSYGNSIASKSPIEK
ncbi:MAG TPA: hypothetical protein VK615_00210, partial [Candidatus Binatia bacterium]|nr:hypothetical protein [Candidatus Binatia bacterium]